ncbi:MAG: hypothetical protein ABI047_12185 [Jatrophihabitantaceae bacterium]
MFGPSGVKSTPRQVREYGAGNRSRSGAFPRFLLGGLVLLASWWPTSGSALAVSYPPAIGCAVSGVAQAGAGVLDVQAMGFRAGSQVLLSVAGRRIGAAVADPAGSFEGSWLVGALAAGATLTAADAHCTATGLLSIQNLQSGQGEVGSPGGGSAAGQPHPVKPGKTPPAPGAPGPDASPEPEPPVRQGDPVAAAIPSIPPTGLPPQLFLGVAGALLLAGAALTGLTGRLGHRSERRPAAAAISGSSTLPGARVLPDGM